MKDLVLSDNYDLDTEHKARFGTDNKLYRCTLLFIGKNKSYIFQLLLADINL